MNIDLKNTLALAVEWAKEVGEVQRSYFRSGHLELETKSTVRQTARQFGISKSTVHKDVTERLEEINPSLASETRKVLDVNKAERHIRGGLATKEKYLHQHIS